MINIKKLLIYDKLYNNNMKIIHKLINEQVAKSASNFMKCVCYFVIFFYLLCLVLSFMVRQSFHLHTSQGTFDNAIYAEENHQQTTRFLTVHTNDEIHITTQVGLSLMYATNVFPIIFAYWFLSRVFANINKGQIFTEQNACYLLCFGLINFLVALFVPFIKLFICYITNLFSSSNISIATGSDMLNNLIPNIAFIVAAYIIHYGIHLQDEVDHTL